MKRNLNWLIAAMLIALLPTLFPAAQPACAAFFTSSSGAVSLDGGVTYHALTAAQVALLRSVPGCPVALEAVPSDANATPISIRVASNRYGNISYVFYASASTSSVYVFEYTSVWLRPRLRNQLRVFAISATDWQRIAAALKAG